MVVEKHSNDLNNIDWYKYRKMVEIFLVQSVGNLHAGFILIMHPYKIS